MNTQVDEIRAIETVRLGTIEAASPGDVIVQATSMAERLADIINTKQLYTVISQRKYVRVEGWTTLGAMLGILPREVEVAEHDNGDFEATVELIRASDGAVVGRASSIVSSDEKIWSSRPRYARRSMAVTRATGKAYRLGFSWIIALAGYEPTPAEEMPEIVEVGQYREVAPKAQPARKPVSKPHDEQPEQPYQAITGEPMTIERAFAIENSDGVKYGDLDSDKLSMMTIGIGKALKKDGLTDADRQVYEDKLSAIKVILQARNDGSI